VTTLPRDVSARTLVVGTRGSALALVQTQIVCDALRNLDESITIRVERITTTGDVRGDVPLSQLGRGIFVSEIETALRERRIDFAVHSAKDLPSTLTGGVTLAAFLPRADARDVLVSRAGTLRELPHGARVGTSSPRRTCLLRSLRPDLDLRDMRGNVDTRLRKLARGEFDAIVLAAAGLIRLGREDAITEWLDVDTMIPCVGQGALAVEVRSEDADLARLLACLDDAETRAAVTAERAFLAELGAGCRAAVGAHACVDHDGRLRITAMIGATDGQRMAATRIGEVRRAAALGSAIARDLLRRGAATFMAVDESALAGRRVAVTRSPEQSVELMALLRARGAQPVSCPTIAIEPTAANGGLDLVLKEIAVARWMVFTSANAVRAVADRLNELGLSVPASVRIAAVGDATAEVLAGCLRHADLVATTASAQSLAEDLPDVAGHTVLVPQGDLASDVIADRLRDRGALVRAVVAYHTVPGAGIAALASRIALGELDAIVFASPSSVRFAAGALRDARLRYGTLPVIACIGPTTARAARELGFPPDAVATSQSVGGIVETLERCLAANEISHFSPE
jgi:hydroxymethylbilane synthase